jgi:uncharacterized protein (TIGR02302 family)
VAGGWRKGAGLKRPSAPQAGNALPRRLRRWIAAARRLIIAEALWAAFWPPLGLLALYLCAVLLGLPQRLGERGVTLLFLLDLLAALGLLGLGLARVVWPDERAARARLARASGLAHDPLGALEDSPAGQGPEALALWRAHQARNLAATRRLRLGLPWPWRARPRDLVFRGAVLGAVALAVWYAGPNSWSRLAAGYGIAPASLLGPPAPPPTVTAWITPPAYTGRAPTLLGARAQEEAVPLGARLTVTVSGLSHAPRIAGVGARFQPIDGRSFSLDAKLDHSGLFTLRGAGRELARWQLIVQPDTPPSIGFAGLPGPDADGQSLRLPWQGRDDYGVTAAEMRARLIAHPDAPPLVLRLSLPDGPAPSINAVQVSDLSANPWAGLPVRMHLVAHDAAGQAGASAVETVTLPERHFHDPFAQETTAIRRELVAMPSPLTVEERGAGAHAMFEVADGALGAGKSAKTVLPLLAAGWQLVHDQRPDVLSAVEGDLWQVALHFEQGNAADTAQSLAQAAAALRQALAGGHASAAKLSALVHQLQAAMLQHLSTLIQMAQAQGGAVASSGTNGQRLDLGQLSAAMHAMQDAARTGDLSAMRAAMAELQQSLSALEQARVVKPDAARMAARAQAEQTLLALQALMRKQAGLLDRSHARAAEEAAAAANGTPAPPADRAAAGRDAAAQSGLRQRLQSIGGEGSEAGKKAGEAMQQAATQLGAGADPAAAASQKQALLALQQAADALGRSLARGQGAAGGFMLGSGEGGQPGSFPGFGLPGSDSSTDPLGRPLSDGEGSSFGAELNLPGASAEQARLRAILRELRDRAGDRTLSKPALDYIERLLQPF